LDRHFDSKNLSSAVLLLSCLNWLTRTGPALATDSNGRTLLVIGALYFLRQVRLKSAHTDSRPSQYEEKHHDSTWQTLWLAALACSLSSWLLLPRCSNHNCLATLTTPRLALTQVASEKAGARETLREMTQASVV